jgi:hypothetical protein
MRGMIVVADQITEMRVEVKAGEIEKGTFLTIENGIVDGKHVVKAKTIMMGIMLEREVDMKVLEGHQADLTGMMRDRNGKRHHAETVNLNPVGGIVHHHRLCL